MKVMKYSKTINADPRIVNKVIQEQNLAYFQNYDSKVEKLKTGLKVRRTFQTKTNRENIPGYSKLTHLDESCIELKHCSADSEIVNTYQIEPSENGTKLTYCEANTFKNASREINFSLVSIVYRFFFNRHMKQVFSWIEKTSLEKEGAL